LQHDWFIVSDSIRLQLLHLNLQNNNNISNNLINQVNNNVYLKSNEWWICYIGIIIPDIWYIFIYYLMSKFTITRFLFHHSIFIEFCSYGPNLVVTKLYYERIVKRSWIWYIYKTQYKDFKLSVMTDEHNYQSKSSTNPLFPCFAFQERLCSNLQCV